MSYDLSPERLRERLLYDPETGLFRWVSRPSNRVRVGDVAGASFDGYVLITLDSGKYLAHRLAWFWMVGEWPSSEIDHADLNRSNNRWGNLRLATPSTNRANQARRSDNTSGFKGVSWDRRSQKWAAYIGFGGRKNGLGYFDTPEAAHAAYVAAAEKYYGEFARAA